MQRGFGCVCFAYFCVCETAKALPCGFLESRYKLAYGITKTFEKLLKERYKSKNVNLYLIPVYLIKFLNMFLVLQF